MMGRTHAMSGAAAGLALAPVVGLDSVITAAPFAATVAGYALVPDLDCHGAVASRLLGPFTGGLSRLLRWCSVRLYQATRGPEDEGGPKHGGHRHMTHCLLFVLLLGGLAAGTSLLSPWVVAGWLAFGVLAAASALGDWLLLIGGAAAALPTVLGHAAPVAVLAEMQGWVGIAVGVGCLVHVLGDMATVSGVPVLFPVPIRGETWQELHLLPRGFRLHTGKKVEQLLVFPGFVLAAAAAALLMPDVRPHVLDLINHVQNVAGSEP